MLVTAKHASLVVSFVLTIPFSHYYRWPRLLLVSPSEVQSDTQSLACSLEVADQVSQLQRLSQQKHLPSGTTKASTTIAKPVVFRARCKARVSVTQCRSHDLQRLCIVLSSAFWESLSSRNLLLTSRTLAQTSSDAWTLPTTTWTRVPFTWTSSKHAKLLPDHTERCCYACFSS